ncbi:MAG: MBL fold metallo-hydrolase [Anaerolineales bacterium]|nr:MBL fold metallo-hydrolase [Anaerolineales bacterium]
MIDTLDLHFLGAPRAIAAFLVRGPAGPVLIETGPGSTLPALLAGLAQRGVAPEQVQDVLVTHIHLDHAGAAGWWARQGARIHVHAIGAPHLADPSRLLLSARRIYGDQMDALWGDVLPAPVERLRPTTDGAVIEAGGLRFVAHDTPGHARHHLVYQLDDVAFVGDLGGVRRRGRPLVRLPTPPPEFDLPAWSASVARMRALSFRRIYLTHFDAVAEAAAHWDVVTELLPQYVGLVKTALEAGQDRDAILAEMTAWEGRRLAADGIPPGEWPVYASLGPAGMSVDGLLRYWQKQGQAAG